MTEIRIGKKRIGDGHPTYIIAEIGLNHQGDVTLAKKLIDHAVAAHVDAVKFQKRDLKSVYAAKALKNSASEENATHYSLRHIQKSELSEAEMRTLCQYARTMGVEFLCTAWDEESLAFLNTLDLPAYKIASADMFNLPLIGAVAELKKPILISTGMSFMSEVEQLFGYLDKIKAQYVLLHTNSTYPTPFHDVNLRFINTLQKRFHCLVGYSGHEAGISVSAAAVALGACVIERHITLDREMVGPDHKASLEPAEFAELVKQIRVVETSLGDGVRIPSRGEYINRETLAKSIVAAKDLKKGTVLTQAHLNLKSPGKGTSPMKLDLFIGKKLTARSIKKDDYVLESDINLRPRDLFGAVDVRHAWGVVARMSDIDTLMHCGSDFAEIHLTGSDVSSARKYTKKYPLMMTVHGPEYDGDTLLDLSSLDDDLRKHSIAFFNKALAYARTLKRLFVNKDEKVMFVVHPGGMNMQLPKMDDIPRLNRNFADSLHKLDADGFELLVENMPGCAWCFGGQWYHTNFMNAEEIAQFSNEHGYGVVFDTSHAALYCNQYEKDILSYAKKILPVARYLHISDAARINGEGLQIGDGSVPWKPILDLISKTDLWMVPEIWQGHKFGGEGFMKAMYNLKKINPNL